MFRLNCIGYLANKIYTGQTLTEMRKHFEKARAYRYQETSFGKTRERKLQTWELYKEKELIKSGEF